MKALFVPTDGDVEVVDVDNRLVTLQSRVGGYIEIVRGGMLPPRHVMVINEDGLRLELPINHLCSLLYRSHTHGHPIVGDALIMVEVEHYDGADFEHMPMTDHWATVYQSILTDLREKLS